LDKCHVIDKNKISSLGGFSLVIPKYGFKSHDMEACWWNLNTLHFLTSVPLSHSIFRVIMTIHLAMIRKTRIYS